MPLTLQQSPRRTHLEQRLEFSLLDTTHLVFCLLHLEHRNISKLVHLMQDASALLSLRFFARCVRTTSIIKKEEGFGFYTKFPFIILSD
jgi:hypothetical protein